MNKHYRKFALASPLSDADKQLIESFVDAGWILSASTGFVENGLTDHIYMWNKNVEPVIPDAYKISSYDPTSGMVEISRK